MRPRGYFGEIKAMKLQGQLVRFFAFALMIAATYVVGCAKNQHKHAPVCPYGQVLTYDDSGYVCRFASVGYGYNNYNMNMNMYGNNMPGSVINTPIANCPVSGQILVNWRGQWYCYFNDQIYPGGGDSPVGVIPPPGRGGEFCTSVGMSNYGYNNYNTYGYNQGYNGYNTNMYGSNTVMCSIGFQCVAQQTQVDPNNPQAWTTTGFGFGQSGTCQYTGYRGF